MLYQVIVSTSLRFSARSLDRNVGAVATVVQDLTDLKDLGDAVVLYMVKDEEFNCNLVEQNHI